MQNYLAFLLAIPTKINPLLLAFRFVQYTQTISVFLVAMFLAGWAAAQARLSAAMLREWLLAAMMASTIVLSVATACQDQEVMPMLGLIPVLMVASLLRLASESQRPLPRQTVVAAVILGGVMLFHAPKDAALSWAFNHLKIKTMSSQAELAKKSPADANPSMKMLEKFPQDYAERIYEGVSLVDKAGAKPHETLFLATTVDDVTIFTGLRYAKGNSPWWQFLLCETPESYPLFKPDLLADVKWILQDRNNEEFWPFLMHYRGEYVRDHFTPVAENRRWTLWKRIDRLN